MSPSDDRELTAEEIVARLARIHPGAALESWDTPFRDAPTRRYHCVVVCPNPHDEIVEHPLQRGTPSRRVCWQRDNLVVAFGRDLRRVLWIAGDEERRKAVIDEGLTLWFDRLGKHFYLGPRGDREGAAGDPWWADIVRGSQESPLILSPKTRITLA